MPLKANPVPLQSAELTTTSAEPAVRVPPAGELLPIVTLPKLMEEGETANCPGATPVPVHATLIVGVVASLTIWRFPFSAPPDWGENLTVKSIFCPELIVNGSDGAETKL